MSQSIVGAVLLCFFIVQCGDDWSSINSRSSVSSFIISPAVEFLDPNLSQSHHICRKQKTSKAALVDIFLSFKLGSFSVSIQALMQPYFMFFISMKAHNPENQTPCLFLIKYSDFLVKGKRVVLYLSRRCRWRPCLLKSSWCSGSVMRTSKQKMWSELIKTSQSDAGRQRREFTFLSVETKPEFLQSCASYTWVFTVTKRKGKEENNVAIVWKF